MVGGCVRRSLCRECVPNAQACISKKLTVLKNLDRLPIFVHTDLRVCLLKAFPPSDDPDVVTGLIKRFGGLLTRAILNLLARYNPQDARRDFGPLLRCYPYQTAKPLNQALCYFRDVRVSDFVASPFDTLAAHGGPYWDRTSDL